MNLTDTLQTVATGSTKSTGVVALIFCNHTAVNETIDVYVIPNGESQGDEHTILKEVIVEAKDTVTFNEKVILNDGDTIEAKASTSGSVALTVSYKDL
jgi:hypothetical protein